MLNNYHHKPKPIIILSKDEEKQYGPQKSKEIQKLIAGQLVKPDNLHLNVAPIAIGMELEVEDVKNLNPRKSLTEKSDDFDKDAAELLMYFKTDSSLVDGFEIVSHPRTIKSWIEIKNRLKDFMKKFKDAGFRSYDTGRCGMHFHINRTAFHGPYHIAKFIKFWEQNHELSFALSRRSVASMATYSHIQTHKAEVFASIISERDPYGSGRGSLRAVGDMPRAELPHHSAVALTQHTVEVRIFRGTMNVNTILTTMEMVAKVIAVTAYSGLGELGVENVLKYIPDNKKNKKIRKLLSMRKTVTKESISNKSSERGGGASYASKQEQIYKFMSQALKLGTKDRKKILEQWIGKANEYEIKLLLKNTIKVPDLIGKTKEAVFEMRENGSIPNSLILVDPETGRIPTRKSMISAIYDSNRRLVGVKWASAIRDWHKAYAEANTTDEPPDWGEVTARPLTEGQRVRNTFATPPIRPTFARMPNAEGLRAINVDNLIWAATGATTGGN